MPSRQRRRARAKVTQAVRPDHPLSRPVQQAKTRLPLRRRQPRTRRLRPPPQPHLRLVQRRSSRVISWHAVPATQPFFGAGTFLPALRASDSPIAMACFGFVTVLPLRPLFSLPCFIAFISRSTLLPAARLYLRVDELFLAAFLVVMVLPPHAWKRSTLRQLHRNYCLNKICVVYREVTRGRLRDRKASQTMAASCCVAARRSAMYSRCGTHPARTSGAQANSNADLDEESARDAFACWTSGSAAQAVQLPRHKFVQQCRIRLTLRQPHHVADEERSDCLLAAAILLHLLRIGRDHLVDHSFNDGRVRNLLRLVPQIHLGEVFPFCKACIQQLLQHLARQVA